MKKIFSLAVMAFLVAGCVSSAPKRELRDFNPVLLPTADEQEIGRVVVDLLTPQRERKDETREQRIERILSCYTEDATITTGGGKPIIVTKEEYRRRLKAGANQVSTISYGYPDIRMAAPDKAIARCEHVVRTPSGREESIILKMDFVKRGDAWKIIKFSY